MGFASGQHFSQNMIFFHIVNILFVLLLNHFTIPIFLNKALLSLGNPHCWGLDDLGGAATFVILQHNQLFHDNVFCQRILYGNEDWIFFFFFILVKERICFDEYTEMFRHGSLTDKGIVNYSVIKNNSIQLCSIVPHTQWPPGSL